MSLIPHPSSLSPCPSILLYSGLNPRTHLIPHPSPLTPCPPIISLYSGLDTQRQKDWSVEAAVECLLSTSTLEVVAVPDMDLTRCVDHFLEGKMTVSQVLGASGLLEDVYIQPHQAHALRQTTGRCLKWAQDPDRPPIGDTTFDEAAAIQLYTQHSCLYPRLNSALRDHAHPENLNPVLPYLKLLLKGLNKLPLVRAKVYRGVRLDLHKQYNQLQGKTFTWWAFSSTTMDAKLMQSKLFLGTEGARTLFSIDAIGNPNPDSKP